MKEEGGEGRGGGKEREEEGKEGKKRKEARERCEEDSVWYPWFEECMPYYDKNDVIMRSNGFDKH